jgi:hypothetical protein
MFGTGVGVPPPQPPPLLLLPLEEFLQPLLPLLCFEPPPRPPRPPRPPQPLPPPLTSSIWLVLSSCKFRLPNFIFYLFLVASRKNTIEGTLSEILQSEGHMKKLELDRHGILNFPAWHNIYSVIR